MKPIPNTAQQILRAACLLVTGLFTLAQLTGCVVVGASSTGGWFIWPGGLGLLIVVLIAVFLLRGRR